MPRFIHLHGHTAYSLLEGAIHVKDLVRLCTERRMPAIAITDSNNMFCSLEASVTAMKEGIQFIPGAEINFYEEEGKQEEQEAFYTPIKGRLVLLAQSEKGYANLTKLTGMMYIRHHEKEDEGQCLGVTYDDLAECQEGIICLTGGGIGPLHTHLRKNDQQKAEECLKRLKGIFHDRLYVEIDRHEGYDQRVEEQLIDLAYQEDISLVASNNFYFASKDMFEAWDALSCIASGHFISDTDRPRGTQSHFFTSEDEMVALFSDLPEALENTVAIAQRCYFMPKTHAPMLPDYTKLHGDTSANVLSRMSFEGLETRLKELDDQGLSYDKSVYEERLSYEISIINQMGFPGYFLIVADFVQWAKDHDVPVGPGRGSGVGSIVAWVLRITDLDPIRFGLLFERFLNPERVSMPDFDIDICGDKRDRVISYIQHEYGKDRVAGIITFGKLQARAVLRDVGRVLEMSYGHVDRICRLVPNDPTNPMTLREALDGEPAFRKEYDEDYDVRRLVDLAMRLEGLYRHASTHAGGIVISEKPLVETIPLYHDSRSDMPVTGYNMKYVEQAGLVKFDLLGLKTLTMLQTARDLIFNHNGKKISFGHIPLDDQKTYDLLAEGKTVGVFQLESPGMRDILRTMYPSSIEDLIAVVALYRPGPMENLPSYLRRKTGEEKVEYWHPLLEDILKETVGIPVYQEQVMKMAQVLAGYSLGEADLLRRAMGKKIKEEMDAQRKIFCKGALEKQGIEEGLANYIFDQISAFAGYGFNKGHAAAYAFVSYQTAWLKANYPVQFLAASMTLDLHNTDKLNVFRMEAADMGIAIFSPSINNSEAVFSIEMGEDGYYGIRYALGALKNVGVEVAKLMVESVKKHNGYQDIFDVFEKTNHEALNKRALESMVKAGVFDELYSNRHQLYRSLETLLRYSAQYHNDQVSAQTSLFGEAQLFRPEFKEVMDWDNEKKALSEFEAVGMYLSLHPIISYRPHLNKENVVPYNVFLENIATQKNALLCGIIEKKRMMRTSKGSRMAFLTLSDETGVFEVALFSEALSSYTGDLNSGELVVVQVTASDDGRLTGNRLSSLDTFGMVDQGGWKLVVEHHEAFSSIKEILDQKKKGRGYILVSFISDGRRVECQLSQEYALTASLRRELQDVKGVSYIEAVSW